MPEHSPDHPEPNFITDRVVLQINYKRVLGYNLATLICPTCSQFDWSFCLFRGSVTLDDWPFTIPVPQN